MARRERIIRKPLLERMWDRGGHNRRVAGVYLSIAMLIIFGDLLLDAYMGECDDCGLMDPRIPRKSGIGWFVDWELNGVLACVDLPNLDLRVTESYPPTFPEHASVGHRDGTSVDIAHNGQGIPNGVEVANVVETFETCNASATYEVTSDAREQELISGGVPESAIHRNGNATGEHYHINCYRCRD